MRSESADTHEIKIAYPGTRDMNFRVCAESNRGRKGLRQRVGAGLCSVSVSRPVARVLQYSKRLFEWQMEAWGYKHVPARLLPNLKVLPCHNTSLITPR